MYVHSPKVIVIAGPPAAGKTTVAESLRATLNYSILRLDSVNTRVARKLGIDISDVAVPHPAVISEYDSAFIQCLRDLRYNNIVFEGCRISHEHIFNSFANALSHAYGEYVLLKCFYLSPEKSIRLAQYNARLGKMAEDYRASADRAGETLFLREQQKGFVEYLEPVLPGFEIAQSGAEIDEFAKLAEGQRHPRLPDRYAGLIKEIAESGTYNPFYQRIEINGECVVRGFTNSNTSWENINRLQLDFREKKVCDIGCMHGFFSFKAEEAGAHVTGVDVDPGAIRVAGAVARERGSACLFRQFDVTKPFTERFDIIMALNVLHRVADLELACDNIFQAAEEFILEIGEAQLEGILRHAKKYRMSLKKIIKSHRVSNVAGQRIICHMGRQ